MRQKKVKQLRRMFREAEPRLIPKLAAEYGRYFRRAVELEARKWHRKKPGGGDAECLRHLKTQQQP